MSEGQVCPYPESTPQTPGSAHLQQNLEPKWDRSDGHCHGDHRVQIHNDFPQLLPKMVQAHSPEDKMWQRSGHGTLQGNDMILMP